MMEKLNIGFISPGPATWPHYESFMALVPSFVQFDFQGLGLYGQSLYEITGKKTEIVSRIGALADQQNWHAVIVIGAPTEVMNPGLFADLKAALPIPVTTALSASIAALRSYGAHRLLLLTPFEDRLNQLIVDHLTAAGFNVSAPRPFKNLDDARSQAPESVYELTKNALSESAPVDAVYFQGAVLDPLKVLERIETELNTTVIASNPAMLWDILSQLGKRYSILGYGKLLADWPAKSD
jgi:maleate cis-trans isomerase